MTPSVQNLNAKLAAPAPAQRRPGTVASALRSSALRRSGTRVRIAGSGSSYRGGYHLSGR